MLVPVSYHEPFASSKHQTMIIAGTYKARQDCPGAFATPTLCHILQKQTCFVADACPCQLPWAVCKQQGTVGVPYTRHLTVGGPCTVDWIPGQDSIFGISLVASMLDTSTSGEDSAYTWDCRGIRHRRASVHVWTGSLSSQTCCAQLILSELHMHYDIFVKTLTVTLMIGKWIFLERLECLSSPSIYQRQPTGRTAEVCWARSWKSILYPP